MPCLGEAALAILACKPSAVGLECDLGGMSEVLEPKRLSLKAGLVEFNMFLKINKYLVPTNPEEVSRLDKDWEFCIPKRPAMNDNEDEGLGVADEDDDDDDEDLQVYP